MNKKFMLFSLGVLASTAMLMTGCGDSDDGNQPTEGNASSANTESVYALMNVPYNDFFMAELSNNDIEVSAVSSATSSKWARRDGTYNVANESGEGGTILGTQYPVKMTQEEFDHLTTSITEENADYYVTMLETEPGAYKELTTEADGSYSFGEVVGATIESAEEITYEFTANSSYGDYEVEVIGLPEMPIVSAVEIVDKDGKSYGLRDLENIWGSNGHEISWSSGVKLIERKGNTLVYDHYESLAGNTLTSIKYFTPEGTLEFPVDIYLPLRFTDELFTVGNYSEEDNRYSEVISTGNVSFNFIEGVTIPEDYTTAVKVTMGYDAVDVTENFTVGGDTETLSWNENVKPGRYSVVIMDTNGVYADYSENLYIMADGPAAVPNGNVGIVKAEGISDEEFAEYIAGISYYYVQEEGSEDRTRIRSSSGSLITVDGSIDYALQIESDDELVSVFESGKTYTITIYRDGYETLEFNVTSN